MHPRQAALGIFTPFPFSLFLFCAADASLASAVKDVPDSGLCREARDGHGPCPVTLLQTDSRVRSRTRAAVSDPGAAPPPQELRTWGRTFLSTEPVASANFFVKYFGAAPVPLPDCSLARRTAVSLTTAEGGPQQILVFIRDPSMDAGTWNATQVVLETASLIMDTFGPGAPLYTPLVDNHDGYTLGPFDGSVMNWTAAVEDRLPMMWYAEPGTGFLIGRVYVPGTLWTVEPSAGSLKEVASQEVMQQVMAQKEQDPDLCRGPPDPTMVRRPGWWKATYMAAKPSVAAQFMVDVFGAEPLPNEYPEQTHGNCTVAHWVSLPQTDFQVHFVFSGAYQSVDFSIEEQVQAMDGSQALISGSFHASMYNSLVLLAESLDGYVLRLRAWSLPYRLTRTGPEQYALFLIVPENAITIQLRSRHLSVEAPISQETCAQDFGHMVF